MVKPIYLQLFQAHVSHNLLWHTNGYKYRADHYSENIMYLLLSPTDFNLLQGISDKKETVEGNIS